MATPDNIPQVHSFMLDEWYEQRPHFISPEVRHPKSKKALRKEYSKEAVGFVQLQRVQGNPIVTVEALVTPGPRLNSPCYNVRMAINEPEEEVVECLCLDCPAATGGCKHALALFWWLVFRTELKETTSEDCYWKRSSLSEFAEYGEVIEATHISESGRLPPGPVHVSPYILNDFRTYCEGVSRTSALALMVNPHQVPHPLSLHRLAVAYKNSGHLPLSPSGFLSFIERETNPQQYLDAEVTTRDQSASGVWHDLRYGRITASHVNTAAHCQTPERSTVEAIMGAYKFESMAAIERGKKQPVLKAALGLWETVGFTTSPDFPCFGASPDAIFGDAVVEVKCPSTAKGLRQYRNVKGQLMPKIKAQLQMDMKMVNRKKAFLIIADPKFNGKDNDRFEMIKEKYDGDYVDKVMNDALVFWSQHIFPKLIRV